VYFVSETAEVELKSGGVTAPDKRRTHVPYRDSKLTHLLQDSLGKASPNMPEFPFRHFRQFQNSGIVRGFGALSREFGYFIESLPLLERFQAWSYRRFTAFLCAFLEHFRELSAECSGIRNWNYRTFQRNVWSGPIPGRQLSNHGHRHREPVGRGGAVQVDSIKTRVESAFGFIA